MGVRKGSGRALAKVQSVKELSCPVLGTLQVRDLLTQTVPEVVCGVCEVCAQSCVLRRVVYFFDCKQTQQSKVSQWDTDAFGDVGLFDLS